MDYWLKRLLCEFRYWDFFRDKKPDVDWWYLIWCPHAIPKQVFFLWLAVQNQSTTGDHLLVWVSKMILYVVSVDTVLKAGSPFFSSVTLALKFGSHVCKGVLVWSILLSDRMC
jgi:hypothetical protein